MYLKSVIPENILLQQFSSGVVLFPSGYLAMSGIIFDRCMLPASSGQRPEMLLNMLQGTGRCLATKNHLTHMSIVPRLRNPVLQVLTIITTTYIEGNEASQNLSNIVKITQLKNDRTKFESVFPKFESNSSALPTLYHNWHLKVNLYLSSRSRFLSLFQGRGYIVYFFQVYWEIIGVHQYINSRYSMMV